MQKSETANLVWKPGMTSHLCPICQPRSSHAYKPDFGNFSESVEAARPRLLRLAGLNGIELDEVEDVVQETLLEAWRHLENLREPGRFSSWLDGVCRNVCKRHLRTRMASLQTSHLDTSEDEIEPSVLDLPDPFAIDPAEELERLDRQALLDRALGHLETSTREMIELCYLAEIPQREVAERLDMSIGALELRLHRARRQLRRVLYGELHEDARAFGLRLHEDEAMGWQETRHWCWLCGKQRLHATFERQPSGPRAFRLRCPVCSPRYTIDMFHTGEMSHIGAMPSFERVGMMRSFRPAFKLTLLDAAEFSEHVFGKQLCSICQSPVQIDLLDHNAPEGASGIDDVYPPGIYARITCANCGTGVFEWITVMLRHERVRAFLLEHPRMLFLPSVMDTYAGQEAVRSRLLDLASGERLTIMTHPRTFQTMAILLAA
ncbi:RNA polymerase sigma factor [Ktedonosporobacter rubrisoli]|nr:sigma-70 family RNA polymerase sigma factor [Ktedonosporobacter rubrisoli]